MGESLPPWTRSVHKRVTPQSRVTRKIKNPSSRTPLVRVIPGANPGSPLWRHRPSGPQTWSGPSGFPPTRAWREREGTYVASPPSWKSDGRTQV